MINKRTIEAIKKRKDKNLIRKSILHWEKDILKRLKKEKIHKGCSWGNFYWKDKEDIVPIGASDCPLCREYFQSDCLGCPLAEAGDCCMLTKPKSSYLKFLQHPTLKKAEKMIAALKELL